MLTMMILGYSTFEDDTITLHCSAIVFNTNCTLFDRIIPTFSFLVFSFFFFCQPPHARITSVRLVTFSFLLVGDISASSLKFHDHTLHFAYLVWRSGGDIIVSGVKMVLGLWDGGVGNLCIKAYFLRCISSSEIPFCGFGLD